MSKASLEALARRFFDAYGAGDLDAVRSSLAPDAVTYITNAQGGADRVEGRDGFMERLPDTSEVVWSTAITQVLAVDDERVLTMVEVKAQREGKKLHNHAAFLARVADDQIQELWMVEAEPAYSDAFWS